MPAFFFNKFIRNDIVMKKLFLAIITIVMVFSLEGCSLISYLGAGAVMGNRTYLDGTRNQNDTKVLLQENNFKVVGTAKGEAKATYVFGIGGLSPQAVKGNAIADMYENANLTGAQAIIDVSFSRHDKNIVVYNEVCWTCHGLIIEFVK